MPAPTTYPEWGTATGTNIVTGLVATAAQYQGNHTQSGVTYGVIRYQFNAADLSGVLQGHMLTVSGFANAANNGTLKVKEANDTANWIDVLNTDRLSNSLDETGVTGAGSVADAGAVKMEPSLSKKKQGFLSPEKPADGWLNWWFNLVYLWIVWIKDSIDDILVDIADLYDQLGNLSFPWTTITADQTAAINNGYISNSATRLAVTLPSSATVGSIIEVQGKGAGGWRLKMPAGVSISYGSSTASGSQVFDSDARYNSIKLLCITADTGWAVNFAYGNFSVNNVSPQFLANNVSWSASANDGVYEDIHTALSMTTAAQRVLHLAWFQDNGSAAGVPPIKNLYNSSDETVHNVQAWPRRSTYALAALTPTLSAGVNTFKTQAQRQTNFAFSQIRACAIELPATNEASQTLYQALLQDSALRLTSNTSFTDVTGYSLTGTCLATKTLIIATGRGGHSGTRHETQRRLAVDGAGVGYAPKLTSSGSDDRVICLLTLADVTAGSRTFTVQSKNDGVNNAAMQYTTISVAQLPATINGATALRAQILPSSPGGITAGSGSPVEIASHQGTMGGANWALIFFGGDFKNSDVTKFGWLQIKIDGVAVGSPYKFGDIDGNTSWPNLIALPWFTTERLTAGPHTFSVDAYADSGNTFTPDNLQLTIVEFG